MRLSLLGEEHSWLRAQQVQRPSGGAGSGHVQGQKGDQYGCSRVTEGEVRGEGLGQLGPAGHWQGLAFPLTRWESGWTSAINTEGFSEKFNEAIQGPRGGPGSLPHTPGFGELSLQGRTHALLACTPHPAGLLERPPILTCLPAPALLPAPATHFAKCKCRDPCSKEFPDRSAGEGASAAAGCYPGSPPGSVCSIQTLRVWPHPLHTAQLGGGAPRHLLPRAA